MKAILSSLLSLVLMLSIFGCSEDAERENPLDAQNKRTGGVLPGLKARAGDSQVALSWPNLGLEGIAEYKIYQAYLQPTPGNFEFVASIAARPIEEEREYIYTVKNLQNDGENVYFYRLAYVDSNGQETPDPQAPQNLLEDWFITDIIPSKAPPTPEVQVIEDTDLQIRLVWEGYSANVPEDLAGFRVYSALKAEEGEEQGPFNLLADIDDPRVEFYIDGNNYPDSIYRFRRDGVTRRYKVVAYDRVGVESDSAIQEGTSPDLPSKPPPQVRGSFNLGINSYDVRIEWKRNVEPDVVGYVIYALWPDGKKEFKKKIDDPNETVAAISDRYVVVDGSPVPKEYFVTAFDNTPKPDGKRDESEPSVILSAM